MACILFFDDLDIVSYDNMERVQGRPVWQPQATLEDAATEGTHNFPCVWHDRDAGIWRAVYGARLRRSESRKITQTLYAESPDGIDWTIPDLTDELDLAGERLAINQIFPSTSSVTCGPAYFDAHDPDPNRRLKAMALRDGHRALLTCPVDGKRWTLDREFADQRNTDYPNSIFRNRRQGKYVVSGRQIPRDRKAQRRTITFMETEDFDQFSRPRTVAHLTPNDPQLCEFYGMSVFEYEQMYVGLLWRLFGNDRLHEIPVRGGTMDSVLTYSYDGRYFPRALHQPFIEPNELGQHGCGCMYTSSMVVDDDHQIRFYSGASKSEHFLDRELTDAALLLHTMRLDGFYYLKTLSSPGHLRTMKLTVNGPDLRLNVCSPFGSVRAQLLDGDGKVIAGCSFDDCQAFRGDELFWTPQWTSGRRGLDACGRGDEISLEMEFVSAALYAIRGDFETFTLYNDSWDQ